MTALSRWEPFRAQWNPWKELEKGSSAEIGEGHTVIH